MLTSLKDKLLTVTKNSGKRSAVAVAEKIKSITSRVDGDRENLVQINHILTNSSLTRNISQCLTQIKQLYSSCEVIEQKLVELEDVINEAEFRNIKKKHLHHLDCYRQRKAESLKYLQQSLEDNYQQKLKDHDIKKKSQLEERQKVFQEAFRSDLETYKHLGTIPKVNLPKQQNGAILEEIELDFDQKELDKFFEDENNVNGGL
ncbi:hypothetical protein GWI33_012957 [Rhynchophorus ferrugineus]|uniref:Dysbindin-like protein n=1 Tax=Rhynchophorus ferrugineus TaxID=354439 RepID=A0A834I803_RHYFE|nr:hypothetical protein GWI33_012957 [Rhynchophorus ferrugineus]